LQQRLGEEQVRQYNLKNWGRPADDKATLEEVSELVRQRKMEQLKKIRETAFVLVTQQNAKDQKLFFQG
jgi:hypothetical protein